MWWAATRRGAFTARAELAVLVIGDADKLSAALAASSDPAQMTAGPISSQSRGGYVEVGYDVMHVLAPKSDQGVTVFTRFDYVNTQADVPAGFAPRLDLRRASGVFGLVWHPIPQIAIKGDYRRPHVCHRTERRRGSPAAITWLF